VAADVNVADPDRHGRGAVEASITTRRRCDAEPPTSRCAVRHAFVTQAETVCAIIDTCGEGPASPSRDPVGTDPTMRRRPAGLHFQSLRSRDDEV
jgi:hypothetical protein